MNDSASVKVHPTTNPTTAPDPDLAMVVAVWHSLPHAIRAGIVAMIVAAQNDEL